MLLLLLLVLQLLLLLLLSIMNCSSLNNQSINQSINCDSTCHSTLQNTQMVSLWIDHAHISGQCMMYLLCLCFYHVQTPHQNLCQKNRHMLSSWKWIQKRAQRGIVHFRNTNKYSLNNSHYSHIQLLGCFFVNIFMWT